MGIGDKTHSEYTQQLCWSRWLRGEVWDKGPMGGFLMSTGSWLSTAGMRGVYAYRP